MTTQARVHFLKRPSSSLKANGTYRGADVWINERLVSVGDIINGSVIPTWDCGQNGHLWRPGRIGQRSCAECGVHEPRRESPYVMREVERITASESKAALAALGSQSTFGQAASAAAASAAAMGNFGQSAADASAALRGVGRLFARRLPPPEWQEWAKEEAAKLGMDVEFKVEFGVDMGGPDADPVPTRAYATIKTRRGSFDVEPDEERTWQMVFAELGVGTAVSA